MPLGTRFLRCSSTLRRLGHSGCSAAAIASSDASSRGVSGDFLDVSTTSGARIIDARNPRDRLGSHDLPADESLKSQRRRMSVWNIDTTLRSRPARTSSAPARCPSRCWRALQLTHFNRSGTEQNLLSRPTRQRTAGRIGREVASRDDWDPAEFTATRTDVEHRVAYAGRRSDTGTHDPSRRRRITLERRSKSLASVVKLPVDAIGETPYKTPPGLMPVSGSSLKTLNPACDRAVARKSNAAPTRHSTRAEVPAR